MATTLPSSPSPKSTDTVPGYESPSQGPTEAGTLEKTEEKYSDEVLRRISKQKDGQSTETSTTLSSISDINNKNWKTPGDRELRKIVLPSGEEETLYFTPNKYHHKKLFVSFIVDDVCVDSEMETVLSTIRPVYNHSLTTTHSFV